MVSNDVAEPEVTRSLATTSHHFDVSEMRDVKSLDDALRVLQEAGIAVQDASEVMGDGFELLDKKDKGQLVGVPFIIMSRGEAPGDYGKTFVSLRVVTKDGRKLIVNDGGTGIRDQVIDHEMHVGPVVGMHFPKGLRQSEYSRCPQCETIVKKKGVESCVECGHSPMEPGETFYLDLSK